MTLGGARLASRLGRTGPVADPAPAAQRTRLVSGLGRTAGRRGRSESLYDYAFIAVTTLLEEHGVPAVLRYFELFAERQDPVANFLEAFGESEEEFEERLRRIVWP